MTLQTTSSSRWIAMVVSVVACLFLWTCSSEATDDDVAIENIERYAGNFEIAEGRSLLLQHQEGKLRATAAGKEPWSLPTWNRMSSLDVLADPVRISRGFLNTVTRGQSYAAHALMTEEVRFDIEADSIGTRWQDFEKKWGKYLAKAAFSVEKEGAHDKVSWLVEFEHQLVQVDVVIDPGMGVVSWQENADVPQRTVELRSAEDGSFFVDASPWQLPNPRLRIEIGSDGHATGVEILGSED